MIAVASPVQIFKIFKKIYKKIQKISAKKSQKIYPSMNKSSFRSLASRQSNLKAELQKKCNNAEAKCSLSNHELEDIPFYYPSLNFESFTTRYNEDGNDDDKNVEGFFYEKNNLRDKKRELYSLWRGRRRIMELITKN